MPTGIPKNGVNSSWFKKGHKHSKEMKERLSKAHKGKKLSVKHRKKISVALMGNKNTLGFKHTEKTKKRRSEIAIKNGFGKFMLGRCLSEETKAKIREASKGEKGNNWQGGKTSKNMIIRASAQSQTWRRGVFVRDNYICQKCKIRGDKLCSHHIRGFAQYLELRFAINNGITLCKNCHKKFHTIYGRKNNNEKQLKKFLL